MKQTPILAALAALAVLGIVGCSNSGPGTTTTTDSSGVTTEAAIATSSEASAMASSMTDAQISSDAGTSTDTAFSERPDALGISGCPTVDIKSTGPEGHWTDKLLTFANPPCSISGRRGYDTLAITGTIELMRSNAMGLSFNETTTNLDFSFTTQKHTYSETRNGTRNLTATASSATLDNSITVVYAGAKYDGTLTHSLAAAFTPASGSSLAYGEPLPSGAFNISGSAAWDGTDGKSGTFNVTTVQPLQYDASCKGTEPSVFDSGELQLQLASTAKSGTATVTWASCGVPTITYTATQ